MTAAGQEGSFKGRHFTSEVIHWALRWRLAFPISYRDLVSMLSDRGIAVDRATLFRWVQAYTAQLERQVRRHLRLCTGSWRVDETYIEVNEVWIYLYRAVDSLGQTIDFLLSARRDAAAAKRFFREALAEPHIVNPRTITMDKNPAFPSAAADMKRAGELWCLSRLWQCKYLNNIVEQDHRRIKRLVRPGLGFGSLRTARQTLAGCEVMAMIRKGQVHNIGGRDMRAQAAVIAELFEVAASSYRAPPRLACRELPFATDPSCLPITRSSSSHRGHLLGRQLANAPVAKQKAEISSYRMAGIPGRRWRR